MGKLIIGMHKLRLGDDDLLAYRSLRTEPRSNQIHIDSNMAF